MLLCRNCHILRSFHEKNLTDRELLVFNILTEGHSKNINPYDGRNYFTEDKAFLQYMRGEKGNPDWCRPENSFFVPILCPPSLNNTSSFSQISWRKQPPAFQFDWRPTPDTHTSHLFPLSRYDGDEDIALGAALFFRREKRAEGISYRPCQEDSVREQELIAKFLAWQGSSPAAPPASAPPSSSKEERQGSSPAPPSSSPSFEEELEPEERRAWADMDRLLEDRLGRRGGKRETSAEEKSHPPKRYRCHPPPP